MAAVIGSLRVVLGADTGSFEDGLKKAGASLVSFSKITAGVAAGNLLAKAVEKMVVALGDVVAATFHAINAMDKMGKEAQKLGISVEELSKLSVTAKLADVEIVELSKSVVELSKRLVEGADNGTAPARRALTALGISFKDFVALKPDQQMEVLADRFSRFRDGADKTAAATALFGRAGANLIPLLNEGSDGFRKTAEMASKLGLVLSGEASAAAQKFQDNMKLVELGLRQGVTNAIAEKLLPVAVVLSEVLRDLTFSFLRLVGAGNRVDKAMEDLRNKMKLPTDEEARKAQQFKESLFALDVATLQLGGHLSAFPAGFIQMAASLGIIDKEISKLPQKFTDLSVSGQQLFAAMRTQEWQKAVIELSPPWDAFVLKIANLKIAFDSAAISQEEFKLKSMQAAAAVQTAYANAAGGISGALGEMFTAIGGEQAGFARAAKIAAAAQALFSAYAGSAAALQGPFPANLAAAAIVLAKGLSLAAAIKGTPLGFAMGGSFQVPGSGGMDTMPVSFMATPGERVTVETPEQQRGGGGKVVEVRGSFTARDLWTGGMVRDMIEGINSALSDGHRIKMVR